jgi:hypothetical protein
VDDVNVIVFQNLEDVSPKGAWMGNSTGKPGIVHPKLTAQR